MSSKPYPSQTQDRYIVRFPDGMRERIADAAKANNRSMNAEIVARLESTFTNMPAPLDALSEREIQTIKQLTSGDLASVVRTEVDEQLQKFNQRLEAGQKQMLDILLTHSQNLRLALDAADEADAPASEEDWTLSISAARGRVNRAVTAAHEAEAKHGAGSSQYRKAQATLADLRQELVALEFARDNPGSLELSDLLPSQPVTSRKRSRSK